MTDQEQLDKDIDNQIAQNEAKRAVASQARVSAWAILAAVIIVLIGVSLYLTR